MVSNASLQPLTMPWFSTKHDWHLGIEYVKLPFYPNMKKADHAPPFFFINLCKHECLVLCIFPSLSRHASKWCQRAVNFMLRGVLLTLPPPLLRNWHCAVLTVPVTVTVAAWAAHFQQSLFHTDVSFFSQFYMFGILISYLRQKSTWFYCFLKIDYYITYTGLYNWEPLKNSVEVIVFYSK